MRFYMTVLTLGAAVVATGCRSSRSGGGQAPSAASSSSAKPTTSEPSAREVSSVNEETASSKPRGELHSVTLTVVFDNEPFKKGLASGWGWSCLVESDHRRVLFDAGNAGASLIQNLQKLDVEPSALSLVVISHAHGDHTGGVWALLDRNEKLEVYLPEGAGTELERSVRAKDGAAVMVCEPKALGSGMTVTGPLGGAMPEQALLVQTPRGVVMVVGCSHPGIETMLDRVAAMVEPQQIWGVIGGLHLGGAGQSRIERVITSFRKHRLGFVAPAHCTGEPAKKALREAFGDVYQEVGTGTSWRLDADSRH